MWYKEVSKDSDVVISSRVRFARSIANLKFPHIMNTQELRKVMDLVDKSVDSNKYTTLKMKDIDETTKGSLVEQHLISKEFVMQEEGEVVFNKDSSLVMMVNEEDHLRIQTFASGFNIDECYNKLIKFTNGLNKKIDFAISDKYGYLVSCPTNVGSAMRVSVMLHLPALAKLNLLNDLLDQAASIGFSVRGLYGENTSGIGYIYQISNQKTLGITNEDIISNLKLVISSIIEQERKARKILESEDLWLEDAVYRAYGILKNSRIITSKEALKLLSDLRLGVSMNMLKDIKLEKVQSLITQIEPYTLRKILGSNFNEQEENIKRAEYIRKELV